MLSPYLENGRLEAGCDEAGRGCLAGPVFAAAVVLPSDFEHPLLNDSKQVSPPQRDLLREYIESHAIAWAVEQVNHEEIDRINILRASFKAMHGAIGKLKLKPDWLLIDGNRFIKYPGIGHTCLIKGDSRYASIAAASILAKTRRDEYMLALHNAYPQYNWKSNKGYPTAEHRLAISRHGLSPHHRRSFHCLDPELPFDK